MEHCSICNNPLQNFPTTELLCHHRCHTLCFLQNIQTAQENLHFLSCVTCDRPVFGQEEDIEEAEEVEEDTEEETINTEQNRISNLYDTNEEFRKDIKKYVTALRGISKPKRDFRKLVTSKRVELQPRYAQIKALYEGLYDTKKNEVMTSNEYKLYRAAYNRVSRYWSLLREKYELNRHSLNALSHKRGCKSIRRPHRYCITPSYIIRRALRLRLPWW